MKSRTFLTSNVALVSIYALVAIAGLVVMTKQQAESNRSAIEVAQRLSGLKEERAAAMSLLTPEPAGPSTEKAGTEQPRRIPREKKPGDSAMSNRLPESDPSRDPQVARRQRKIPLGENVSLGGFRPFPDDDAWNREITNAPVDPNSAAILASIGFDDGVHPDFGSGTWEGAPIGIPYVVVSSAQPLAPVRFVRYGDESDAGPYPIPPGAPVEGAPSKTADRHVIVIDRDQWKLYELSRAFEKGGYWQADCGAVFDLSRHPNRPYGWTSADAAGLPIFPGLVRYDEVDSGEIRHALRFTVEKTRRAYVPPARHWASRDNNPILPPMGMRLRLKQDVNINGFPKHVQVILRCLKKYGMILADNGSDLYISGAPDERWDNDALHTIKKIKGRDFEVIRMDGLVTDR